MGRKVQYTNSVRSQNIFLSEEDMNVLYNLISGWEEGSVFHEEGRKSFEGKRVMIIVNDKVEFDYYVKELKE